MRATQASFELRDCSRYPYATLNVQVAHVTLMAAEAYELHEEARGGEFTERGVLVDPEGLGILRHSASVLRGPVRPASQGGRLLYRPACSRLTAKLLDAVRGVPHGLATNWGQIGHH
jgi:hypothetical protein